MADSVPMGDESRVTGSPKGYNSWAMPASSLPARAPARSARPKRLLALLGDERLVEQMARGNEAAFEVAFERHGTAILGFCRHMLGSVEDAEDAVQHTFAAAWRDLGRGGERDIALRPWLYAIARNRCLSMLRARREHSAAVEELPTAGLSEEVERRRELRELLADLRELPEVQRAALLLSEAAGLAHADVADVLGCPVSKVKSLVFQARSALIARREARDTPCEQIREQLANLRGGSLRRTPLRLHVAACPGCREYREEVRRQRRLLGAALPVLPGAGLKASVLAAAGLGGSGSAAGGLGAVFGGAAGSALLAKAAVVGVLAGGGVVAGNTLMDEIERDTRAPQSAQPSAVRPAPLAERDGPAQTSAGSGTDPSANKSSGSGNRALREPRRSRRPRDSSRSHPQAGAVSPGLGRRRSGHTKNQPGAGARSLGKPPSQAGRARGRGPIAAPPGSTPVKRGPAPKPVPAGRSKHPSGPLPAVKAPPNPKASAPAQKAAPPATLPPERGKAPKL